MIKKMVEEMVDFCSATLTQPSVALLGRVQPLKHHVERLALDQAAAEIRQFFKA